MTGQQLKNSILQMAIQGKLVPQDPHDEPASVLLERIREEKKRLVKEGKIKKSELVEKPISEDEIPFDIPEGWVWVRLKSIVLLITKGSSPSWQGVKYVEKGILFITSENVREGYLDLSSPKFLEDKFNLIQSRSILKKGDLLTNIVGASIGRTAEFNLNKDNCNINQAVAIIRLIDCSFKFFLLKVLNSNFIISQMLGKTVETARANISLNSIENLLIPLPPLSEQRRIVEKLESLMPLIESYGKSQEALNALNASLPEKLRQSILQEAIQGHLVPQDPNEEPASVLLERIRAEKARLVKKGKLKKKDLEEKPISPDEIPFDIPEGWVWVRIGHVYQTSSGGTPEKVHPEYYNGNIFWAKVGDLTNKYINSTEDKITEEGINNSSAKVFPKDTILVAMYCNDAIGKSSILSVPMATNQAICGLFPNSFLFTDYIYYAIQRNKSILQASAAGGAQQNINQKIVNELIIPLPPLSEQRRIVTKLEELLQEIDKLKV